MSIDKKYVLAPGLQQYFVDKTTGFPLANGKIYFYSDTNRSALKTVYRLSGSAPNYTFTQLPNPVSLSNVGTPQDEFGNDILIYYYPYDVSGKIELYYIEAYSQDSNLQFVREAFPSVADSSEPSSDPGLFNYIPNGQFVTHNQLLEQFDNNDNLKPNTIGKIKEPITEIACGGWSFERPQVTTSEDFVTFNRFGSYNPEISQSPRYAVDLKCTSPNLADSFKYLKVKFKDVNKFSSSTQQYTYVFYGKSITSGSFDVDIVVTKFFGTGGAPSPTTETIVETISITQDETLFNIPFVFGQNDGKEVGLNNDDYVSISINLPVNRTFEVEFTDHALLLGNVQVIDYPIQTFLDTMSRSIVPISPPFVDGNDLYLPMVQTPSGLIYDNSIIGRVEHYPNFGRQSKFGIDKTNLLLCDGSQYHARSRSSLGIPYNRLSEKLYDSTAAQQIYGTGKKFVTVHIANGSGSASNPPEIFIGTNQSGSTQHAVDGNTGFTFKAIRDTSNDTFAYGLDGYFGTNGSILAVGKKFGFIPDFSGFAFSPGTSGFSIFYVENTIGGKNKAKCILTATSADSLAGKYFRLSSLSSSLVPQYYYMWFKVGGSGSDPAPSGLASAGFIDLNSYFNRDSVAYCVSSAISGHQIDAVKITQIPTAGSYFKFWSTPNIENYVWFKVNGSGDDPNISNAHSIPVSIQSNYSLLNVASAIQDAVNKEYFCVPDYRGTFLVGQDPTDIWAFNDYEKFNPYLVSFETSDIHFCGFQFMGQYLQKESIVDNEHVSTMGSSINYYIRY